MKNIDEWQLFHLAAALTRAKRLEKQREDFHEELYNCIIYPSVQIDQSLERAQSHATDSQAIRIIEAKERYERLVHKEYDRYIRWQSLLEWLDEHDQIIMIRYFEKKKSIQPKIISRLLSKIQKRLDQEEKRIEQERSEKSLADYRRYQEKTRAFRKIVQPPKEVGPVKNKYLIRGQFVQMTEEEYMTFKSC